MNSYQLLQNKIIIIANSNKKIIIIHRQNKTSNKKIIIIHRQNKI